MRITSLGAAQTVTGSMHLLEINGRRVLLDCGLYQGRRQESLIRNRTFPFDPRTIDALVLSHAHIDHSGNIPNLVRNGFQGPIFATPATRDLCSLMLLDSGRIQESDVAYVNKRRARRGEPPVEPIYTEADARTSINSLVSMGYRRPFPIAGDAANVTFLDSGHILGSATTVLDIHEDDRAFRFSYTGDLGRAGLPILRDPEIPTGVDALLIESTYGARLHEELRGRADELRDVLCRTYDRGGKVIIPAFAVGRTQEIIYDLHQLIVDGQVPSLPIFVDSPLAVNVTEIFRLHPEVFDREILALLDKHEDPFGFYRLTYTRSVEESKALNDLHEPCVIISASGMCEAGRVLHHLINNVGDPKNTVLFVGYQAENTLGRKLKDGWEKVPILGDEYDVRCEIATIDAYSAHADREDLLAYVKRLHASHPLQHVFLVHGDLESANALAEGIRALGVTNVVVPERAQTIEL